MPSRRPGAIARRRQLPTQRVATSNRRPSWTRRLRPGRRHRPKPSASGGGSNRDGVGSYRRDRDTTQAVHLAHPGQDLPTGAAPSVPPHRHDDDGSTSRAGSRGDDAGTPRPVPAHRDAGHRDRRHQGANARRTWPRRGSSLSFSGIRRAKSAVLAVGAMALSAYHPACFVMGARQVRLAPGHCADRPNATAAWKPFPRSTEYPALSRHKHPDSFRLGCTLLEQQYEVLHLRSGIRPKKSQKTHQGSAVASPPLRAGRADQSRIDPLSRASAAYSERVRLDMKYRSRSTGRPSGPRMVDNSERRTLPSSGMPSPRSHRPKAVSPSWGSSSVSSQVAWASGVNSLTTGSGS